MFQLVDPAAVDQAGYVEYCRLKNPVRVSRVPRVVLYGLALGLECLGRLLKRNVPLTRYKVRSVRSPAAFDCAEVGRALGWSPRVGTEEGLKATFSNREAAIAAAGV